ncbi:MAG: hypothetical protein ABJA89_15515 [Lapillicoccus sp.]
MATTTSPDTHRHAYPPRQPVEVVAVLADRESAARVARTAVEEAVERHLPVRFLEVLTSYTGNASREEAEEILFRAGLHALRGHPRTHSVFEVVRGQVAAVVGQRSLGAALLVVGEDEAYPVEPTDRHDARPRQTLAERCLAAAECPVRTVPGP